MAEFIMLDSIQHEIVNITRDTRFDGQITEYGDIVNVSPIEKGLGGVRAFRVVKKGPGEGYIKGEEGWVLSLIPDHSARHTRYKLPLVQK